MMVHRKCWNICCSYSIWNWQKDSFSKDSFILILTKFLRTVEDFKKSKYNCLVNKFCFVSYTHTHTPHTHTHTYKYIYIRILYIYTYMNIYIYIYNIYNVYINCIHVSWCWKQALILKLSYPTMLQKEKPSTTLQIQKPAL